MTFPAFLRRRRWGWLLLGGVLALAAAGVAYQYRQASERRPLQPPELQKLVDRVQAEAPWYYRWRRRLPNFIPKGWFVESEQAWNEREFGRWHIESAFRDRGTNAWPAVPALLRSLRHQNPSIRFAAASALGAMKADGHPDWETLAQRLKGSANAVSALQYLLVGRDSSGSRYDAGTRRFALLALAATGPAAAGSYPEALTIAQSNEEAEVRSAALSMMAAVPGQRTNSVRVFATLLRDAEEWPPVSATAAETLASVAPKEPETLRILREALQDQRSAVRLAACRSLWKLEVPAGELLPVLTPLLSHKLASTRCGALKSLAAMGAAADAAAPEVRRLMEDGNETVRQAAAEALGSMGVARESRRSQAGGQISPESGLPSDSNAVPPPPKPSN
jgi:HEAT repeat protein